MHHFDNQALLTDFYELTMAQGYFDKGRQEELATFELFYRSNPFEGGYAIFTGVHQAVQYLKEFSFSDDDIEYLRSLDQFSDDFLDYLADLTFDGQVHGIKEGSVVFPYEPLVQVTAPIIVAQLVESALLNIINYATLIATKAARITYASASEDTVLEFGLRRGHGDGAIIGARAAIVGGCVGTSNTLAGKLYGLPVSGTQAHSWIQSFESELEAFRAYATTFPDNTVLLVDTYDTLGSGVPNAIKVAHEMEEQGHKLRGIRIDSGDLAWNTVEAAKLLNEAGLDHVKIVLSSDLDEYLIQSIVNEIRSTVRSEEEFIENQRLIDRLLWGVGTYLITGSGGDKAALGGVYKLVQIRDQPVIKISNNRAKTTNPGRKKLWRVKSGDGEWLADVMGMEGEDAPSKGDVIYHRADPTKSLTLGEVQSEELHVDLMAYYDGSKSEKELWEEARERAKDQLHGIDDTHLRFLNPHIYKVSLTSKLHKLKAEFLSKY